MLVLALDHVTLTFTQDPTSLCILQYVTFVSLCGTMWVLGCPLYSVTSIDLTRLRHGLLGLLAQLQTCLPCLLYLEIAL